MWAITAMKRLRHFLREPSAEAVDQSVSAAQHETRLLSRSEYRRRKMRAFAYAAAWGVALVVALLLVAGWWRLLVAAPFLLVVPDGTLLLESYDKYRGNWQRANEGLGEQAAGR
jgi:hypothetical protein